MQKFSQIGSPPVLEPGQSLPEISFSHKLEALKLGIHKLVESHPKDENKNTTRGRVVYLGCLVNDFLESNTSSPNSINAQKWRKEIASIIKHINEKAATRPNRVQIR